MENEIFEYLDESIVSLARFKWEFMRRDKNYKEAYSVALQEREKSIIKPCDELTSLVAQDDYVFTRGGQRELSLAKLFFGTYPGVLIDHRLSFESVHDLFKNSTRFAGIVSNKVAWTTFCQGFVDSALSSMYYIDGLPQKVALEKGEIIIKINLYKVNSKTELKRALVKAVDKTSEWCASVPELSGFNSDSVRKRSRVEYDETLIAGDLYFIEGKSYQEIARQLFPQDFKETNFDTKIESKIKLAKYRCDQYREMTSGGWRDLRYP